MPEYYGTVAEADTYFGYKLYGSIWLANDPNNKVKALIEATVRIDNLNFIGSKTSDEQALQWPRNGATVVHEKVLNATYEVAYQLLDGRDPDLEFELLRKESSNVGPSNSSIDTNIVPEHIVNGIPSVLAWRLLKPLIRPNTCIRLNRS